MMMCMDREFCKNNDKLSQLGLILAFSRCRMARLQPDWVNTVSIHIMMARQFQFLISLHIFKRQHNVYTEGCSTFCFLCYQSWLLLTVIRRD